MDVHERKRSGFAVLVSSSLLYIVASLAHTEEFFKKTKNMDVHERKPSGLAVFVSSLRL